MPLYSAKLQSKSHKFPIFQSLKIKVWILQPYLGPKAPSRARRALSPPQELEASTLYFYSVVIVIIGIICVAMRFPYVYGNMFILCVIVFIYTLMCLLWFTVTMFILCYIIMYILCFNYMLLLLCVFSVTICITMNIWVLCVTLTMCMIKITLKLLKLGDIIIMYI